MIFYNPAFASGRSANEVGFPAVALCGTVEVQERHCRSGQLVECGLVVRFLRDLGNLLGIFDLARGVYDDNRP